MTNDPRFPYKLFVGGLLVVLLGAAPLQAKFPVKFTTSLSREYTVDAEDRKGKVWVDLLQMAEHLGSRSADIPVSQELYVIEFSTFTLTVSPADGVFWFRSKGQRKAAKYRLHDRPYIVDGRLMVSVESLPALFRRSFTYHLQKRELAEIRETGAPDQSQYRTISARHERANHKIWVSVEDVAKALGVVLYSAQANRYNLVLPDFTILELRVEQNWVYRRQERYRLLEDPVLVFSGSPYITVESVQPVFGVEARWDRGAGALKVPRSYGRIGQASAPDIKRLKYLGYRLPAFRFDIEELSSHYQQPGPTYPAQHDRVYDSVRDFMTDDPIDPGTKGYDAVSGGVLASLRGHFLRQPLEARGDFEKLGTQGRVASGSMKWGFPRLEISGGREYVKLAGLLNQFGLMDQAGLSHSNDHFAENDVNPEWSIRALYGRQRFSVFMTTAAFSQTVDFVQDMAAGQFVWDWDATERQRVGVTLGQFAFFNEARRISSDYYLDPFLVEILGEDFTLTASTEEEKALAESFLTEEHGTSLADVHYKVDGLFRVSATGALSYYEEPASTSSWTTDGNWRVQAVLGERRTRLDVSHEWVGPNYRSIGNPSLYQDRRVTRIAPYLDLARPWKIYGEFRREDSWILERQDLSSYRNDYLAAGSFLNLRRNTFRAYFNQFDSTLYGKRMTGNLDWSHLLGRNSLDLGVGGGSQWDSFDRLYRQSYTGRAGFQILRPQGRFGLEEELTKNHYPTLRIDRWQSESTLIVQWRRWKALTRYAFEPKYFANEEVLYTGYGRFGYTMGERKILNVFYATTSLKPELRHPEVWRAGFEYVYDF